jgi:hypothetical protein
VTQSSQSHLSIAEYFARLELPASWMQKHRKKALSLEIQPLAQEQGSRLAEIIARAFRDYPAFRQYIHADLDGDDYKKSPSLHI